MFCLHRLTACLTVSGFAVSCSLKNCSSDSELRTSELRLSLLHGHYETGNKLSDIDNAVKVPNRKYFQDYYGPISSSESALKVTYGYAGGQKNCSPAAGFRPSMCKVEDCSEWIPIKTVWIRPCSAN
jgi:hypothetical protein